MEPAMDCVKQIDISLGPANGGGTRLGSAWQQIIRSTHMALTFRVLEAFASARLSVFLALFDARVPCDESGLFQLRA